MQIIFLQNNVFLYSIDPIIRYYLFCVVLFVSGSSISALYPTFLYNPIHTTHESGRWVNKDNGHYAHQVHLENIKQVAQFQKRFEEQKLINEFGPAFADSYEHEDKVRTARLLKTIRQLQMSGNNKK